MYRVTGNDIELTKGDGFVFSLVYAGRVLPATTQVLFSVKKRTKDAEVLIEKTVGLSNNVATVEVLPEETAELKAGAYYWDARICYADGSVYTPMEYAAFVILEVIGDVG